MFIHKYQEQKRLEEKCKVVNTAILAMGVGVVVGVLIAPKSGKETREDLSSKLDQVVDTLKSGGSEVKEDITSTVDDAAAFAKDAKDKFKSKIGDTVEDAEYELNQVKDQVKDQVKKQEKKLKG